MIMEGSCHAFEYSIVLLLAEFFLFHCVMTRTDDSIKVLVSRNRICHESFRLSTRLSSYKMIFPKRDSRCDDCSNCNIFSTWNCRLNFEIDPLTSKMFEPDVCIDQYNQGLSNCETSHIFYQIGSESMNHTCDSDSRKRWRCRSFRDVNISVTFTTAFPCSFSGHSDVFLRFRGPAPYALFKEVCPYTNFKDHPLGMRSGTIVSEFDHRVQKSTEFCPVLLCDWNRKKNMRFCMRMEVKEFPKSKFAITISTAAQRRNWIAFKFNFNASQRIYCQSVDPAGYIVSAIIDHEKNSLNNHRAVLKYWLVEKDTDAGDGDDNDDAQKSEGARDNTSVLLVALFIVFAVGFICATFYVKHRGKLNVSSFVMHQQSRIEEFFQSHCRRSQTQAGPTAASQSLERPHSFVNESDSFSSGHEISLNGHSQPPLTPSASLVDESELMVPDVTSDPPSYDDVLPSYQHLFPSSEA